jgi:diguanylate cyclase (GGDEF)-like protein
MIDDHPVMAAQGELTVFYVPLYQFIVRILLGSLTIIYFYFLPIPTLAFNIHIIFMYFLFYFSFHVVWWRHFRRKGIGFYEIRLANWVDLISGGVAMMIDPYDIPPTLMLILIIVLGNGIQHGLNNFIITAKNALIICFVVTPVHFYLSGHWPPYGFYFCFVFLIVCAHYAFYLLQRIENLKIQAENLAQLDELTGVMNRRAFIKSAEYLISLRTRNQIPLVFVFADLDGFKKVNDIRGHAVGDMVLKSFTMMAIQNFRKTDIVARYGGDEFVFVLTNSDLENATLVMSRLETQFANWASIHNIKVGISYGIKELSDSVEKLDEILHEADESLYKAKRAKRMQER